MKRLEILGKYEGGERKFEDSDLVGVDLASFDLERISLNRCKLDRANLSKTGLRDAELRQASLIDAKLEGANLRSADLSGADLSGAKLGAAILTNAKLEEASLVGGEVGAAQFSQSRLSGANLSNVVGTRAIFNAANLTGARLESARLPRADFSESNLSSANLAGSDLSGANLSAAQLRGTNLSRARLNGADIRRAELEGLALDGADLTDIAHSPLDILDHRWDTLIYAGKVYHRADVESGSVEFPIRAPTRGYSPLSASQVELLQKLTRELATLAEKGTKGHNLHAAQKLRDEIARLGAELRKSPPPRPGDVVAGAKLIQILGKGGYGTVYDALDVETGERRAVKVFDFDRLTVGLTMYHFRKGVRVMEHLNAINAKPESIVRLHRADPSKLAFSMDLLDDHDLSNIAERGWDIEKKLDVFRTICHGVKFAHEHDVIHRDIKPANIVMNAGKPVLTDFDISDLLFARTLSTRATGSAAYAAPEELSGKGKKKPSSDVYSLGRLLLFLLLERDPAIFHADAATIPSDHPRLYEVIQRCIHIEPKDRYQSVGELLAALPELPVAPRAARPARRSWSREVKAAIVGGVGVVLAAAVPFILQRCSEQGAGSGTVTQGEQRSAPAK